MTSFKRQGACAAALVLGAVAMTTGAPADVVFPDDVIIQGSACVGLDCVNNESFGFDTLILKENNTRILFLDTSTLAGFPSNDWRLIANDSANGGANFFAIQDATAGRQIFQVTAGARANSIFVDSSGRVGFGTATPVLLTHARNSDTPAHRLEQDASGGFAAQTWDVAGNEANFFIRDVTGGSRLPFRIRPGAPTSSIDINATGRVGIATASPTASLHVAANSATIGAGNVVGLFSNPTGPANLEFLPSSDSNANFWGLGATDANTFRIAANITPAVEFTLTSAGNLTISGTLTTGGPTCGGGCDRLFAAGHAILPIDEHARLMWQNGHLPNVGPTPEGQPIDLTDKLGRMLNELEKAHVYIEQLHRRIEALEQAARANKG